MLYLIHNLKERGFRLGATVFLDKIYISKDLDAKLTPVERHIIWAHELYHSLCEHRIQLILLWILCLGITPLVNIFRRRMELEADRYAIYKTRDIDAFIGLMDKLEHGKSTHPAKEERIKLAEAMRGKI